ncbi:hypothetical protein SKAU_G00029890 [Synaphobranchus kaupii]|uniref:Uncharacterized protein n=1 Tax=Synaphobranchus kaupii TaxID=118154 RepID=A0A9Q1JD22_SYNKA|nr:hypothetical protein SKAU_G00029890 [Synaphobranchus kaupii]
MGTSLKKEWERRSPSSLEPQAHSGPESCNAAESRTKDTEPGPSTLKSEGPARGVKAPASRIRNTRTEPGEDSMESSVLARTQNFNIVELDSLSSGESDPNESETDDDPDYIEAEQYSDDEYYSAGNMELSIIKCESNESLVDDHLHTVTVGVGPVLIAAAVTLAGPIAPTWLRTRVLPTHS